MLELSGHGHVWRGSSNCTRLAGRSRRKLALLTLPDTLQENLLQQEPIRRRDGPDRPINCSNEVTWSLTNQCQWICSEVIVLYYNSVYVQPSLSLSPCLSSWCNLYCKSNALCWLGSACVFDHHWSNYRHTNELTYKLVHCIDLSGGSFKFARVRSRGAVNCRTWELSLDGSIEKVGSIKNVWVSRKLVNWLTKPSKTLFSYFHCTNSA